MTASSFELVLDAKAELGECPVWSAAEQRLYFADIKGRRLHRFDPESGDHTGWDLPEEIGCFAPARGGGFIAGLRSGIFRLEDDCRRLTPLAANPEDHETSRFNDGRVDPAGRFLLGTVDEPKAGGNAHLYCYDRRGLAAMMGGITTSNGLAFSPDGRTLYHSDTQRLTVWRCDYDPATGEASDRQVFVRLQQTGGDRGRPDGAAVDAEGCYWVALYEGARVQRYSPAGELMAEHPVPVRCPTMVAFGGADLKTLFVTTARSGRPAAELAEMPHSGGVFALRTDVAGRAEPLFDPSV